MRAFTARLLLVIAVLVLHGGCGGDSGKGSGRSATPELPEPPETFAHLFETQPYARPSCNESSYDLDSERELKIYNHPGSYDLEDFTRGLKRYWRRYGLTFFTRYQPRYFSHSWVLEDDEEIILAELRRRFPNVDFGAEEFQGTDEELRRIFQAAAEIMLGRVLDFAATCGNRGQDLTNVVLLPHMTRSQSTKQGQQSTSGVLGLGISPALLVELEQDSSEYADFWRHFPLRDFTPMFFVNAGLLQELVENGVLDHTVIDIVMSHELGHTLGLVHLDLRHNLMHPGIEHPSDATCETTLEPHQLDLVERTLSGRHAGRTDALSVSSGERRARMWRRLGEYLEGKASRGLFSW